jgi:hypothetical protein
VTAPVSRRCMVSVSLLRRGSSLQLLEPESRISPDLWSVTPMFETLICTTAEIAESLVKFKWFNIAKKLFEVKHKQVALLKAAGR